MCPSYPLYFIIKSLHSCILYLQNRNNYYCIWLVKCFKILRKNGVYESKHFFLLPWTLNQQLPLSWVTIYTLSRNPSRIPPFPLYCVSRNVQLTYIRPVRSITCCHLTSILKKKNFMKIFLSEGNYCGISAKVSFFQITDLCA